jgi:serine/threonine protein kinase
LAGWTVPGYTETRVPDTGEAGRIVEAVHNASGDRVAITYPAPKLYSDPAFRERFSNEAALLAGLEHPNVVRVRELVETATAIALISEAVDGAALRRVLATSAPLRPEAALAIMKASLAGLGAAQGVGVIHRDCQPSNVVITTDGIGKLRGFGLAVRTEAMMPAPGTPSYMAPELWEGATPRSVTDMYAVTATFYECLTGRVPYAADSVFELQTLHRAAPIPVADVPAALGPLIAQGLAKTPVERPADPTEFLAELEAAAVVEFGMEWEERGRRELAALVAALPEGDAADEAPTSVLPVVTAAMAGVAAGAATVTGTSAGQTIWYQEDGSPNSSGDDGEGMGRGTKAGLAAAAIAVIGAVVAAVAFSPGKHAAAAAGPSGELISTPSDSSSVGDDSSPGLAAGGAPTPGASSPDGSSPAKSATSGPTTPTSATSAVATPLSSATPIGLPLSSLGSPGPGPSYPPPPPLSTTVPSTPPGSTGPSTTPSVAVTVSAGATMTKSTYNGPCPPTDPPTGTVTFTVGGLPAGGTVPITYHWHVVGGGAGGAGGGTVGGGGTVDAHDGPVTQQFTVSDDQHSQKGLSGTVDITWTAPGTPGGTTSAGSVDIVCTPGGGASSGGGPSSTTGSTTS